MRDRKSTSNEFGTSARICTRSYEATSFLPLLLSASAHFVELSALVHEILALDLLQLTCQLLDFTTILSALCLKQHQLCRNGLQLTCFLLQLVLIMIQFLQNLRTRLSIQRLLQCVVKALLLLYLCLLVGYFFCFFDKALLQVPYALNQLHLLWI